MPDVIESVYTLINNIPGYLESLQNLVRNLSETYGIELPFIDEFLEFKISSEVAMKLLRDYGEELLPQIANIANISVQIGGALFDIVIAIILSIYKECYESQSTHENPARRNCVHGGVQGQSQRHAAGIFTAQMQHLAQ